MAAHAYRQQARALEPVRHAQVAGVPRAQSEALDCVAALDGQAPMALAMFPEPMTLMLLMR